MIAGSPSAACGQTAGRRGGGLLPSRPASFESRLRRAQALCLSPRAPPVSASFLADLARRHAVEFGLPLDVAERVVRAIAISARSRLGACDEAF